MFSLKNKSRVKNTQRESKAHKYLSAGYIHNLDPWAVYVITMLKIVCISIVCSTIVAGCYGDAVSRAP